MGYDTRFEGEFEITPTLDKKTRQIFERWVDYYPNDDDDDEDGHPYSYMQWILDPYSESLIFNEKTEKFYNYIEWLEFLIEKVFAPNGYKLNGGMRWNGESLLDTGIIKIENNKIIVIGTDRDGDLINYTSTEDESTSKQKKIKLLQNESPEKT